MSWNRDAELRHEITAEEEIGEVRSQIDVLMHTAKTAEQWIEINRLCKSIRDEPPIHTSGNHPFGNWQAYRSGYEPGCFLGTGKAEAVADLLEQEDA